MIKRSIILSTLALLWLTNCQHPNSSKDDKPLNSRDMSNPVLYYSEMQQDSILKAGIGDSLIVQSLANYKVLAKGQNDESYIITERTVEGYVERHERWDDVAIIRSGRGVLRTGYQVRGLIKETGKPASREWRGGVIEDVKEIKLSPGDFIIIPAMTAHQYIPDDHDTLRYWTIKIRRTRIK